MAKILDITGHEILDSRGIPALCVKVMLDDGITASASTATNITPTSFGVVDIKDNDLKRFQGNGLLQIITIIEKVIKPRIIGLDSVKQKELDQALNSMDTSVNKNKIGGNTILAISIAVSKAAALSLREPLYLYLRKIFAANTFKIPIPIFTMIDGGKNANFNTDFAEFLLLPASNKSLKEAVEMGAFIHKAIADELLKENILPFVGEKGGFGPLLSTNEEALALISQVLESANIRLGYDAYLGIDAYANSFFKDATYKIKDHQVPMSRDEIVNYYTEITEKHHLLYLEDPLSDSDLEGWSELYSKLNQSTIIAGDYFTSTNPYRLQVVLQKNTINGIVIKPSFVGTVTEALAVSAMAREAGLKIIVSDRTGSTNETFLVDFAVGISADYVRFGALVRGERVAKYNRLLEIDDEITKSVNG